jgi:hypothetical protein
LLLCLLPFLLRSLVFVIEVGLIEAILLTRFGSLFACLGCNRS